MANSMVLWAKTHTTLLYSILAVILKYRHFSEWLENGAFINYSEMHTRT